MTRALIMSDSHGMDVWDMREALESAWQKTGNVPVDCYIHCGDGVQDMEKVRDFIVGRDPKAAFCMVRGNCDWYGEEPYAAELLLGGVRVFVTHGHHYHVKDTLLNLNYAAQERGCAVALYGHTHTSNIELGSVITVNPGSLQNRRMACLIIEAGQVKPSILQL